MWVKTTDPSELPYVHYIYTNNYRFNFMRELRKVKSKVFKTKKEATEWAKKEKKNSPPNEPLKWETNRIPNHPIMNWEVVIYRKI